MSNSSMRTTLNFEDDKVKTLLSEYDLHFFLEKYLEYNSYSKDDIDTIYQEYNLKLLELQNRANKSSTMFKYHIERMAKKIADSGFIHALFYLDNSKQHANISLQFVGGNLAYFEIWQEYYTSKIVKKKKLKLRYKNWLLLCFCIMYSKII